MPVHRYDITNKHDRPDLVAVVANELLKWKGPDDSVSPPDAPDIYIKEGAGPNYPVRIYVVWEKWKGINERQRTGVIMDALEQAGLSEEAQRTAIAMGLTREEADALGITN